jgi:hypothetical protein
MKKLLGMVSLLTIMFFNVTSQEAKATTSRQLIYQVLMSETGEILAAELVGCAGTGGTCLDEVVVKGEKPVKQS